MTATTGLELMDVSTIEGTITAGHRSAGNSSSDWLPSPICYISATADDDEADDADRERGAWADLAADALSLWARENPY
jgi:hypothetical protein